MLGMEAQDSPALTFYIIKGCDLMPPEIVLWEMNMQNKSSPAFESQDNQPAKMIVYPICPSSYNTERTLFLGISKQEWIAFAILDFHLA